MKSVIDLELFLCTPISKLLNLLKSWDLATFKHVTTHVVGTGVDNRRWLPEIPNTLILFQIRLRWVDYYA